MPDIYISSEDLKSPRVDAVIAMETAAQAGGEGVVLEDVERPLIYNPMFCYSVSAAFMAFLAWVILEPFINDLEGDTNPLIGILVFMVTAAMVGLALGTVYGLANRNLGQAAYCGAVGFGVGFLAAIPATFLAGIVFAVGMGISVSMMDPPVSTWSDVPPVAFFALGLHAVVRVGDCCFLGGTASRHLTQERKTYFRRRYWRHHRRGGRGTVL